MTLKNFEQALKTIDWSIKCNKKTGMDFLYNEYGNKTCFYIKGKIYFCMANKCFGKDDTWSRSNFYLHYIKLKESTLFLNKKPNPFLYLYFSKRNFITLHKSEGLD